MQGWHDATQVILQILSNPAWSGIGSLCSLIGIPLAIHLARRTPLQPIQRHLVIKKNLVLDLNLTRLENLFNSIILENPFNLLKKSFNLLSIILIIKIIRVSLRINTLD